MHIDALLNFVPLFYDRSTARPVHEAWAHVALRWLPRRGAARVIVDANRARLNLLHALKGQG